MTARDGVALPIALAGIVLIGILAGSGLHLAAQDRRASENAVLAEQALAAAETGLGRVIEEWNGEAAATVATGEGWRLEPSAPGSAASVQVTRLGARTFWVVAEGRATRGAAFARRRVNTVLRLVVPDVPLRAALASDGPVTLSPGAVVSGLAGPPCDVAGEPDSANAGIAVRAAEDARGDLSRVSGTPPIAELAGAGNVLGAGSSGRAWLAAAATVVLPDGANPIATRPALADGRCDPTVPTNWGEPRVGGGFAPCEGYRRVIHAEGDLRLEGEHRGQGVLLVDGSLHIPGRLEFRGLVAVEGDLDVAGELHVEGAVLVAGPAGSWLGPGSVVRFGRCEVDRALTTAGRPRLARDRGWADLF